MALVPGLYDRPITLGLLDELAQLTADRLRTEALDPDEVPLLLARALSDRLQHALASFTGDERLSHQLHLANQILQLLQAQAQHGGASPDDHFPDSAQKLLAILAPPPPGLGAPQEPTRPGLPLSESELLVNGRRDLSVGPEINKELASADRVDLLCSFLKFSGVRLVKDQLAAFLERHPGKLRVITTVYMGATQQKALDLLREMGARIKVSYDTQRTRLHAKAWLFHRASGYSTGLIGSSNLSHEAMLDGLEWNVRVSGVANPGILKKFEAVFDQYWNDPGFEPYTSAEDSDRFQQAVKRQVNQHSALLLAIQLHPRPHQERILESLAAERERGHKKNLVVAATGTGKTIVAAIDYARLCRAHKKLSLLFVAHRTEILLQSQAAFRVAMKDGSFGDLLTGGEVPRAGTHVFASVQSLHEARLPQGARPGPIFRAP
jgi:HKD family nuclease